MKKQFCVILRKHRAFGYIAAPALISPKPGTELFIIHEILNEYALKSDEKFSDEEKDLINIIEQYNDAQLVRLFSKGKNLKQFYSDLTNDFFIQHIQPYIERRLVKCIDVLRNSSVKLFLLERDYQYLYPNDELIIQKNPAETIFNFVRHENGLNYFLTIRHAKNEMNLSDQRPIFLSNDPCILILKNNLYTFTDIDGKKLLPFFNKEHISIPKKMEEKYFNTFVLNAIKKYEVKATGFEIQTLHTTKKAWLSFENDLKGDPAFILHFTYDDKDFIANNPASVFIKYDIEELDEPGPFIFQKIYREQDWEDDCIIQLVNLGLTIENDSVFKLPFEKTEDEIVKHWDTINWLNKNEARLTEIGIDVEQGNFEKKYYISEYKISISLNKKQDWFDLYAIVKFQGFEIPFIRFKKNILNADREFVLPNGEIMILPLEWFSEYKELFFFGEEKSNSIIIKEYHKGILDSMSGIPNNYKDKLKQITSTGKLKIKLPDKINATLREYQVEGFEWLYRLYDNKLGGCLADDMGLGKTLQTLSLLTKVIEENSSTGTKKIKKGEAIQLSLFDEPPVIVSEQSVKASASLIVAPTSLVHNWENEIKKFTPHLRALKHIGNRDTTTDNFDSYDIILTTYGTVRNDYTFIKDYIFLYVILDESQIIKNAASKTYRAILELTSRHKLVLTGTPIQNSLSDLWSQLNFTNKGLLGGQTFFNKHFIGPIEKQNDELQEKKLQNLIQPFILRRTKQQVAKDLPPLTEQMRYCEMTAEHEKFYEEEKLAIRNELFEMTENFEVKKKNILVLKGLTRLRQIANHPLLVDESYKEDSGKYEEITNELEEILCEDHKILIFSSFVKHLQLVKNYLDNTSHNYLMLTGDTPTKERKKNVDLFQSDDKYKVFLISIKAGGTGLNLTAADYVFILDPWWNPTDELQAQNRAHRIGQDRSVFVYRFLSKNTIEEKIHALQQRKSKLADTFINSNNPLKDMDMDVLKDLFE